MTENLLVDLHHRCQCTTSQTSHLLDRVFTVRGSDIVALQMQLTPKSIVHIACPLHMTSRSDTYLYNMLAVWNHPQL